MSMTDPISDLLTRIRNARLARHKTVDVPASRMKVAIVKIRTAAAEADRRRATKERRPVPGTQPARPTNSEHRLLRLKGGL